MAELPANADSEQKAAYAKAKKARAQQEAKIKQLDGDYQKLLAEWKKSYPGDANIFDSAARINILEIQKNIGDDQAVLIYNTLPDKLAITLVDKNNVNSAMVEVSKKELQKLIRDEFLINYIFGGFDSLKGKAFKNTCLHNQYLINSTDVLSKLYTRLIEPVADEIKEKKKLYIVNDGVLASLPYSALVSSTEKGQSYFLVED